MPGAGFQDISDFDLFQKLLSNVTYEGVKIGKAAGYNECLLGGERDRHLKYFSHVEQAAIIGYEYCTPYENNLPVYVCRNKKNQRKRAVGMLETF